MTLKECLLIDNDCYKKNQKITPKVYGIVVHSTGANNMSLKRYIQPVERQSYYKEVLSDIGVNKYHNHWNQSSSKIGKEVCVHAFIGKNEKGKIETYKTLPFDICCWGCGNGKNGSFNKNPTAKIQFEICEDELKDEKYFNNVMKEAQEFCAYLCNTFGLKVESITSHKEAHKLGFASDHSDIDKWLSVFGKNMKWFRDEVNKLLTPSQDVIYKVQVGAYSKKENADKMVKKLKDAGFNGIIVKE